MSHFRTDTGTKSWMPLVDRVVDDALLQTVPHVNQTLFQIVNVSPSPDKHGPASYPTPCSQQGWGRGCWEATDWEQWMLEPLAAVTRPSHGPYGPVHCPAEKWRSRQKLHGYRAASPFQRHIPIICSIYFDARVHEYEVGLAQLRHTDRYHYGLFESCPSAQQPTGCNVPLLWRCRSVVTIVLRIFLEWKWLSQ